MEEKKAGHVFSAKAIAALMIPLLVEQILAVTVGLADQIMVSRAGEAAVSGVSLVDNINHLVRVVLSALATGGAVVCSQYIGHRQPEAAREAAGQLLFASTGIALAFTCVMLIGGRGLLGFIFGRVEADVMSSAMTYFIFTVLGYPFLGIYNSCAAIYRSIGNSGISMRVSLMMNLINIAGNALFIFVLDMGVAGAAIATLISRVIGSMTILGLLHNKKNAIYVSSLHKLRPKMRVIKKILSVGIPTGIENGIFQLGKIVVLSLIAMFGTSSIMGNSVASSLCNYMIIPGTAISLGLVTIVGHCIGAGRVDEARRYTKILIGISIVSNVLVGVVTVLLRPVLLGLYDMSPQSYEIASTLILWHTIANPIWSLSFNTPNTLRAANDARFTMIVSMISMWLFRVGASYLLALAFDMGVYGVWLAMFLDWTVRSIIFIARFCGSKWYRRKLI